MNDDDYILVCALKQGSNQAFQQLYKRYSVQVYGFILQMVRSQDQAQEIFQHVFVKLWENRGHINPEDSFNAYLYTIARNSVYSYWRQCLNRQKLESYLTIHSERSSIQTERAIEDKDFRAYLDAVIDLLPKRCKEVFILRHRYSKSYREISWRLNISEKTVDNQLQKAVAFIRRRMMPEVFV